MRLPSPHPLAAATARNYWRILRRYGRHVDWRYSPRVAGITLGILAGVPGRAYETLQHRRRIARQQVEPPVFIIGHWRSGTTYMHNLFLQDEQFGYVSLMHCLIFNYFLNLGKALSRSLRRFVPKSRPMDMVPVGLDSAMSEDFALLAISDLTHYVGYLFPRLLEDTFRRTVLFEGVAERELDRWQRHYMHLLRKVTLDHGGKRLVLKNPPHTGRIPHVLKLFSDARFVHVYRNPYVVHSSTCRLQEKFIARYALQDYCRDELHAALLRRQRLILDRFLQDRERIPANNLIDVRHEDAVAQPVETMEQIYKQFDLPGFDAMRPRLERYVESIADYRTNQYEFSPETLRRIEDELGWFINLWDYAPPKPATARVAQSVPV